MGNGGQVDQETLPPQPGINACNTLGQGLSSVRWCSRNRNWTDIDRETRVYYICGDSTQVRQMGIYACAYVTGVQEFIGNELHFGAYQCSRILRRLHSYYFEQESVNGYVITCAGGPCFTALGEVIYNDRGVGIFTVELEGAGIHGTLIHTCSTIPDNFIS